MRSFPLAAFARMHWKTASWLLSIMLVCGQPAGLRFKNTAGTFSGTADSSSPYSAASETTRIPSAVSAYR